MILGDIEKALESYERLGGAILDLNNEEHLQAAQQVIAALPEAARRALAAEARVKELETALCALILHGCVAGSGCEACDIDDDRCYLRRAERALDGHYGADNELDALDEEDV